MDIVTFPAVSEEVEITTQAVSAGAVFSTSEELLHSIDSKLTTIIFLIMFIWCAKKMHILAWSFLKGGKL